MSSTTPTLTRDEILQRYRHRIAQRDRIKLKREEKAALVIVLVDHLIEMNQQGTDTEEAIEALCCAEVALLKEGYPTKSLDGEYLPNYTHAVADAIHDGRITLTPLNSFEKHWRKRSTPEVSGQTQTHYAIEYLKLDPETYAEHRAQTNAHNNDRQDNPVDVELDPYLAKVEQLAHSQSPEEMAIAVAAITGRRHVEVVAQGQFSLSATQHRYLLHFEGQAKKRDDQPQEGFDILTLIPAAEALALIDRFRSHPTVVPLIGQDDEHPDVQAFHARVNRRVEKVFGQSGLVPVLHGFKTVSIHRLRALWGAIAYHFFAPGQKNPQRFLQHYLGHVSDTLHSAANAPVTGHYFHYRLWRNGKELTAKGVKLAGAGVLPENSIDPPKPEAETAITPEAPSAATAGATPDQAAASPETTAPSTDPTATTEPIAIAPPQPKSTRRTVKSLPVDLDRLKAAAAKFDIEIRKSKGYGFEMALDQLLMALTVDQPQAEPEPTITQALGAQAKTLEFLTTEVEALRSQLDKANQERDHALEQQRDSERQGEEIDALKAENQRLKSAHATLMQAYNQLLKSGEQQAIERPEASEASPSTGRIAPQDGEDCGSTLPRPKRTPRRATAADGGATARAFRLFRAVQDWNDQHPQATFALTSSLLKREFGIHDEAIKAFFDDYQAEVDDYHQSIGVSNVRSHNRQSGRDVDALKAFITGGQVE
ncbi:MAG: hypothetical protein F6K28_14060 [Microcoleus sp. SIO2G3]|nr:hypothetical protein [Microcoleus sp. SIO2G3]